MPPAARGALFEKTAPLDPPQKLFISRCRRRHPLPGKHPQNFLLICVICVICGSIFFGCG
jgi:hypothetical protein